MILIGILLTAHLVLVALKHHAQFRERQTETEQTIVGVPLWPGQTPRSLGLMQVLLVFVAGSADRVSVLFGISYVSQLWFYRVLVFVGPVVAGLVAYRVCVELQRGEAVEQDRHLAEGEASRARVRAAQEP